MKPITKKPIPSIEGAFANSDGSIELPPYERICRNQTSITRTRIEPLKITFGYLSRASSGYLRMDIGYRGGNYVVAHLICEAFHGLRPDGMVVSHINENSLDNRPDNLKWATQKENLGMPQLLNTRSKKSKSMWETVGRKEKHSVTMKERWENPEWREKMLAARKNGKKKTSKL